MMAKQPHRQVCPLCALDANDLVTWDVEGPGLWRFTCVACVNPAHDDYSWLTTGRDALSTGEHDGLSAELGLYDDLLRCFTPGEALIEYGVVECRYATSNPAAYKHIVGLYSHTEFGKPIDYSASAFIAAAVGKLGREGLLVRHPCKATGFWKYNGTLHASGLAPGPGDEPVLSWETFAESNGLDPRSWPVDLLT